MNAHLSINVKLAHGQEIMKPKQLQRLINLALRKPIQELADLYGAYYSPYYSFFYYLTQYLKTGVCLELGVETGRGCKALAMGSPGVKVIGLDSAFKVQWGGFTFHNYPSLPPPIELLNMPLDFLHIDTEHSYSMAKAEFEAYQPYLKQGAAVAFDDLHAMENDVLRYFLSLPYYKIQEDRLHPICGYGLLIYGQQQIT